MSPPPLPVVWHTYHPDHVGRCCWDQTIVEQLLEPFNPVTVEQIPTTGGAVIVVPGRDNAGTEPRFTADIAHLDWVVLIVTGDEEGLFHPAEVTHPRIRRWVQTPHTVGDGDMLLPLGPTPHTSDPSIVEAPAKNVDVFFAGQVTHQRRHDMVAAFTGFPGAELVATAGFSQGLDRGEYMARMRAAKVVPCPSGPCHVESFRIYEALESGAVPLVDSRTPDGAPGVGPAYDWVVGEWEHAPTMARLVLDTWPVSANRTQAHYQAAKMRLRAGMAAQLNTLRGSDDATPPVTVLIPTSPILAHPDPAMTVEAVTSVRTQLPGVPIVLMFDGVRPEQENRREAYEEYQRRVLWHTNRIGGVTPLRFDEYTHQAGMTRRALEEVTSPLVLYVEHDTFLDGVIPWDALGGCITDGAFDVIRLHHESEILEPHRYLMLDDTPTSAGVPVLRTRQWSQRPHLASAAYYRRLLTLWFRPGQRTMIEDVMHGVCQSEPWTENRVGIYAPPGDMKRSWHLDGRASEPKYGMDR